MDQTLTRDLQWIWLSFQSSIWLLKIPCTSFGFKKVCEPHFFTCKVQFKVECTANMYVFWCTKGPIHLKPIVACITNVYFASGNTLCLRQVLISECPAPLALTYLYFIETYFKVNFWIIEAVTGLYVVELALFTMYW